MFKLLIYWMTKVKLIGTLDMCGIVGSVGHEGAVEYVRQGLETLEYRGYDSVGVAYLENGELKIAKTLGGAASLEKPLESVDPSSSLSIGHTRWATHGRVSSQNAHPHTDTNNKIAVVHNGTIENFTDLKQELLSEGFVFKSETDTEVIPHLISKYLAEGQEHDQALTSALRRLTGAYAVLAMFADKPDTLYAARLASPLVLGVNSHEHFAASDPSVIVDKTKQAIFVDDREVFELSKSGYRSWHLDSGGTSRNPITISDDYEKATLGEYPHFMIKEINQSPDVVRAALSGRVLSHENLVVLGGLEDPEIREKLRRTDRLVIVACGTSYHAGLIGERLIEEIAGIPVEVQLASEFKYREEPLDGNTAVLAISQSGETADTIAALEKANDLGLLTLGVNNSPGSTIDRITDAGVHSRAGQEVSVASTKAFISQVTVMAEVALKLGHWGNKLRQPLMEELTTLPAKIESILADDSSVKAAAEKYANYTNFLYIGRGYEHISAMEGALKLKEISYIHAEGCSAGEMKHGTLALIDEDFPTFAIATEGSVYGKTVSNIQEIKARSGPVLALATEGNTEIANIVDDVLYVPQTMEQTQPILNAIVMQLFAYYVATHKGLNVDRPRNLAKSVTVE
jgi:glucosamine--fructose-6-phosphate aminotransferase (isomerizing)